MPPRHFPPPWSAEVNPNCFIVRDADGQQLAYVYYESEPGRRSANCKCALDAMWLPDNTVSEIEKTHKQSGSPRRLSRSRNSLASVGARL